VTVVTGSGGAEFLLIPSSDTIQSECFPSLTLEQVYGAITYYLRNREELDTYLKESERGYADFKERIRSEYPRAQRIDSILRGARAIKE